jgi:hypothetical protein
MAGWSARPNILAIRLTRVVRVRKALKGWGEICSPEVSLVLPRLNG